jgi:MYXO-CTERM domain-containing protein
MNRIRSFALAVAATALMGAGAFAQVDAPGAAQPADPATPPAVTTTPATPPAVTTTPATPPAVTTTPAPRDDRFNWGWIGLLGLLGLAGLLRRDPPPVDRSATYPTTRPDSTTTPRSGPH